MLLTFLNIILPITSVIMIRYGRNTILRYTKRHLLCTSIIIYSFGRLVETNHCDLTMDLVPSILHRWRF